MADLGKEIRRRLEAVPVGRLATITRVGIPHLVPVVFATVGETIVTAVDHKPKTTTKLKRLDNITANPAVSLLADHYEDDWDRIWWIRIDGAASLHEPPSPTHRLATDALRTKYADHYTDVPLGTVISIHARSVRSWQVSD